MSLKESERGKERERVGGRETGRQRGREREIEVEKQSVFAYCKATTSQWN